MKSTVTLMAALSICGMTLVACGNGTADNSAARKERIVENLKGKYRQLADFNPSLGEIKRIAGGIDEVEMTLTTPRGEQKQLMLVTADNKLLYMVMDKPVDISKSVAELKAAQSKEQDQRKTDLAQAIKDMPARGPADAPVTIVEFSDFQCPYCKKGFDTMEEVLKKYPKEVKFIFMHYPLPFHPWAKPAAISAVCAAQQKPDTFWLMHDNFFKKQQEITPDNVLTKAEGFLAGSGVDMSKWTNCVKKQDSAEYKSAAQVVDNTMAAGTKLGVEGTPAFFVNGEFLNGALPATEFDRVIQAALKPKG